MTEIAAKKNRVRVRVPTYGETPARAAGLKQARMQAEGFKCECGQHHAFSRWVLAHWPESVEHTCQACGRVHKMRAGVIQLKSGPTKRKPLITPPLPAEGSSADPMTSYWCCYAIFHNTGQPTTFRRVTDYHATLDIANTQAWEYANKVQPYSREKREQLYGSLIRSEEWPLLSGFEINGQRVISGKLVDAGENQEGYTLRLRDPRGRQGELTLTEPDLIELLRRWKVKRSGK